MNIIMRGTVGPMDPAIWNKPLSPADAARAASIAASAGQAAADASKAATIAAEKQQAAQAYAEAVASDVAASLANRPAPVDTGSGVGVMGLAVAGVLAYLALR